MRFVILPGQAHDLKGTPDLLEDLQFGALIGDKAFDADWLLEEVERRGADAVIPSKKSRTDPRDHDLEMYKWRHQIENFFARNQGVPGSGDAIRQDGRELRGRDLSRRRRGRGDMNVHRP